MPVLSPTSRGPRRMASLVAGAPDFAPARSNCVGKAAMRPHHLRREMPARSTGPRSPRARSLSLGISAARRLAALFETPAWTIATFALPLRAALAVQAQIAGQAEL